MQEYFCPALQPPLLSHLKPVAPTQSYKIELGFATILSNYRIKKGLKRCQNIRKKYFVLKTGCLIKACTLVEWVSESVLSLGEQNIQKSLKMTHRKDTVTTTTTWTSFSALWLLLG